MADVQGTAGLHHLAERTKGFLQKSLEVRVRHAVPFDLQPFLRVALVIHVVGRIGKHDIRCVARHQPIYIGLLRSVAAEHAMLPEQPEVASHRDRRFRDLRDAVLVGETLVRILRGQQLRQFLVIEADQAEIEVLVLERGEFQAKQFVIPTGIQREFVVRDDVGALLGFGKVVENDDRDFGMFSLRAASRRPWPAIMPALLSTRIGFVKPNSRMLAAICATWASECVRGFLA